MDRDFDAFGIPTALLIGISIHEMITGLWILGKSHSSQSETTLYKASFFSWCSCAIFISIQSIFLDFFVSPYLVGPHWVGTILTLGFLCSMITLITNVGLLFAITRKLIPKTVTFACVFLLAAIALLQTTGSIIGTIVSTQVANQTYGSFVDHPLENLIVPLLVGAMAFKSLFYIVSASAFLYCAIDRDDKRWNSYKTYLPAVATFPRPSILVISNFIILLASIYFSLPFGENYPQYIYYLPSLIHAFEVRTILELGLTARERKVDEEDHKLCIPTHLDEKEPLSVTRRSPAKDTAIYSIQIESSGYNY